MYSSTLSLTSALVHMYMSKINRMLCASTNIGTPMAILAELIQFTRTVC